MRQEDVQDSLPDVAVAVIGMAGQFPGAKDVKSFWELLVKGNKATRCFSDDELLAVGVSPQLLNDRNYVKAGMVLDDIDLFDAAFFGFSPREAEVMDPQARLFLQHVWHALEDAGYSPGEYKGLIGIFAGKHPSSYQGYNLSSNPHMLEIVSMLQIASGNDADALATMAAYKLDLKGPSLTVQTFCSTSMVAVHLAYQSLLAYECDIALAGGVAIEIPHKTGYLYEEGGILSPDGECRTFDANANGSIYGSGVGVVALKRLAEALEDDDHIYAVIRGSALNNDGITRVGYTAPGLNGQATVILEALGNAGVHPETIGYIEAHGTGTPLGDSIELEAMIQAFRMHTEKTGFCAIGSVKPNIGHLDRASGVTGLIKTALTLHHKLLPPHLNFERPLPDIDLKNSPFYVNTRLQGWPSNASWPHRAGVSSFGLGGTNVHIILEEAPPLKKTNEFRPYQLLLLSAKTEAALEMATSNLITVLQNNPDCLADVAYTLQVGRATFNHRRMVVCRHVTDGANALAMADPRQIFTLKQTYRDRPIVFMFPGVGDHYVGMGFQLYQTEPVFHHWVDECCRLLEPHLSCDLRKILYPDNDPSQSVKQNRAGQPDLRRMLWQREETTMPDELRRTALAQPAVFVVEYALAKLLMGWGLQPKALLGYSLGEYTAACLAGVLSLADAVKLVAKRSQLIETLEAGSMLTVALSEDEIRPYLDDNLSLAGLLTPAICVVAGPSQTIAHLNEQLTKQDIACKLLPTSHAFHSTMMKPITADFEDLLQTVTFHPPQIPYLSNLTGKWITEAEATSTAYWVQHMCQTVRFSASLDALFQQEDQLLLEIGPGQSLAAFARQHPNCGIAKAGLILPTLPYSYDEQPDNAFLLTTLGKAWLAGATIDWKGFYQHEIRHRVSLPGYPFERHRYWVEANPMAADTNRLPNRPTATKKSDVGDWFYLPTWKQTALRSMNDVLLKEGPWLLLMDEKGLGVRIGNKLEAAGCVVVRVHLSDQFSVRGKNDYTINPQELQDYRQLLRLMPTMPTQVVHLWGIHPLTPEDSSDQHFAQTQEIGFYTLLNFIKAAGSHSEPLNIWVITSQAQSVVGTEELHPEKATILGICRVLSQENLNITCQAIDVINAQNIPWQQARLADQIISEFASGAEDLAIAYRGDTRWVRVYDPVYVDKPANRTAWREQGVYLLIGGLGEVGMVIGRSLAEATRPKLIFTTRTAFPARELWENWLNSHEESDRICQRIRQFLQWEQTGAEVWVAQADAANATQMELLLQQIDDRFGGLQGILYTAGISGDDFFVPAQEIKKEACEVHFRTKAHGLYVLEKVLAGRNLDFCIIFSSVSSVLGGLGFTGYAAANNFIDAFTHKHNQQHPQWWTAVNWDTWRTRENLHDGLGATVAAYDMSPAEAMDALERIILNPSLTQLVNSTGDLNARIDQWVRMISVRQAETGTQEGVKSHPRPELMTAYVPPANETEKLIIQIWETLLGITPIGIHDNFLELGGHSLLAIQVISRLRQTFKVYVPLALILAAPTVAELAMAVEIAIIEELENLPDDVVATQLSS